MPAYAGIFCSGEIGACTIPTECVARVEGPLGNHNIMSVIIVAMKKNAQAFVYILTNRINSTIYVGVTSNLERRIAEHKQQIHSSFTKKYKTNKLVYFEYSTSTEEALQREKQLKKWRREKKLNLINSFNPEWRDLSVE